MIYESRTWKEDLLRRAARLSKRSTQRRWSDQSMALLERELMVGFFSIRKLVDSHKVSDGISNSRIAVSRVPSTGYGATKLNAHKVEKLFDFERLTGSTMSLRDLCNQVIHSLVFTFYTHEDGRIESFLVASDREKNDSAVIVTLAVTQAMFTSVGSNYPAEVRMVRNNRGDYDVQVGPGDGTVPRCDVDALGRGII
jgi:hypothetical protein